MKTFRNLHRDITRLDFRLLVRSFRVSLCVKLGLAIEKRIVLF